MRESPDLVNRLITFTDHLGTPLIQTDRTTAIVCRAEPEPYGMPKGAPPTNPSVSPALRRAPVNDF